MRVCFSLSMSSFSGSRKERRWVVSDRRLLDRNWQMASAGGSSDSLHPFFLRFRNLISESPLIEAGFVLFYLIPKFCDLKLAPFFLHPQPVPQVNCTFHPGHGNSFLLLLPAVLALVFLIT